MPPPAASQPASTPGWPCLAGTEMHVCAHAHKSVHGCPDHSQFSRYHPLTTKFILVPSFQAGVGRPLSPCPSTCLACEICVDPAFHVLPEHCGPHLGAQSQAASPTPLSSSMVREASQCPPQCSLWRGSVCSPEGSTCVPKPLQTAQRAAPARQRVLEVEEGSPAPVPSRLQGYSAWQKADGKASSNGLVHRVGPATLPLESMLKRF